MIRILNVLFYFSGFEGIAPAPESQNLYPNVGPTPVETPGYAPTPEYPSDQVVSDGNNIYPNVQGNANMCYF